jgi:hypothetical protein
MVNLTDVEYTQNNQNLKNITDIKNSSDDNTKNPFNFLLIIIVLIIYSFAIYSNIQYINKCNVDIKWLHYLMAIFTAPSYWIQTNLWPSLCKITETTVNTFKDLAEDGMDDSD